MTNSWIFQGLVKEKPRLDPLGEYNGMMVYSEKQPLYDMLDEGAMNMEGKRVIVLFEEITEDIDAAIDDAHETLEFFRRVCKNTNPVK
ncbi:MAG: hypothetical protein AMQ22_00582 [Candidatus Methanofastidiosum methylothiophilum]|uniref:Uncharacterized protein n=1 Tax=Candidatus Methanofastidiosum methylothiophilum TaxID=1705564 RepID=A0A150J6H7_9EURY|nr:MAG: hypothetical protein AMQ22_00582 [Candidatus Methanofastidiosum methylthiophilus]